MQRVEASVMTSGDGAPVRWRLTLACGHTVNRRQDKPPFSACCERRERQAQPPVPHEEKAARAILVTLVAAPQGVLVGKDLRESVIGGYVTERVYTAARRRLLHEELVESLDGARTGITAAGRASIAERRAA